MTINTNFRDCSGIIVEVSIYSVQMYRLSKRLSHSLLSHWWDNDLCKLFNNWGIYKRLVKTWDNPRYVIGHLLHNLSLELL